MREGRPAAARIRLCHAELMGDELQTQILAYVGSWARGNSKLLPPSWETHDGEVTLIKLVVYENGVMPTGRT